MLLTWGPMVLSVFATVISVWAFWVNRNSTLRNEAPYIKFIPNQFDDNALKVSVINPNELGYLDYSVEAWIMTEMWFGRYKRLHKLCGQQASTDPNITNASSEVHTRLCKK